MYVLLDISGSMESRIDLAERRIAKRLDTILEQAPGTAVSYNEFRAKDAEACDAQIEIEDPGAPHSSIQSPASRVFHDDFTPLGSALLAAIDHAGAGPAEIILASDWSQTPACGIDIVEVIATRLPSSAVAITPIAVRPRDSDLTIANMAWQAEPETNQTDERADSATEGLTATIQLDDQWPSLTQYLVSFSEMWAWLVGFLLLAWSAALFGRSDSRRSVKLEEFTAQARSIRARLQKGEPEAEDELTAIRGKKAELDTSNPHVQRWLRRRAALPGLLGLLIFAALAFLPPRFPVGGLGVIDISEAKEFASEVLSSGFSMAFAATWIALIFFSARQNQRLTEAESTYDIATNEAERVAEIEQKEAKQSAELAYRTALQEVTEQEFPDPWYSGSGSSNDRDNFELVKKAAIYLALGNQEDVGTDIDSRKKEAKRLDTLKVKSSGFGARRSFARFVELLQARALIVQHQQSWTDFASAIRGSGPERLSASLATLADELREISD